MLTNHLVGLSDEATTICLTVGDGDTPPSSEFPPMFDFKMLKWVARWRFRQWFLRLSHGLLRNLEFTHDTLQGILITNVHLVRR